MQEAEEREAEERRRIQEFYRRLELEADQRERRAAWRMRRNNPGMKTKRRALQKEIALRRFDTPSAENSAAGACSRATAAAALAVANVQIAKDSMGNYVVSFQDGEGNELTDSLEEVFNTFDTELQNRLATCSFNQLPPDVRAKICHALEFKMAAGKTDVVVSQKRKGTVLPSGHAVPSRAENRQLNTRSSLEDLLNEEEQERDNLWTPRDKNGNSETTADDETDGWRRRTRAGSQVCVKQVKIDRYFLQLFWILLLNY
jgi:hypothetical protein